MKKVWYRLDTLSGLKFNQIFAQLTNHFCCPISFDEEESFISVLYRSFDSDRTDKVSRTSKLDFSLLALSTLWLEYS